MFKIYKMIIILSLILFMHFLIVYAATPGRLVDNKIEFAVGTINGTKIYDQKEIDNYLAISTATAIVSTFTVSDLERAAADSGIKFRSYSDWLKIGNNKTALQWKIDHIDPSDNYDKSKILILQMEINKAP